MSLEEIVIGPLTAHLKAFAANEQAPDITAALTTWKQLGLNGAVHYEDDGVTVALSQSIEKIRGAASTAPIKVYRTEEDVTISLTLRDMRLEMLQYALQGAGLLSPAPTNASGLNLFRGVNVPTAAILLRGIGLSPYPVQSGGSQYALQFFAPAGYMSADSIEMMFGKNNPAETPFEFTVLYDSSQTDAKKALGSVYAQIAHA